MTSTSLSSCIVLRLILIFDLITVANHLVLHHLLLVHVGVTLFKKAQGSIVSNLIWMKFGRIVQVNIHRLTESNF